MAMATVAVMSIPTAAIASPDIMAIMPPMPVMMLVMLLVVMYVMANRSRYPDDMAGAMMAVGPVMPPADFIHDAESVVMATAAE